MMKKYLYSLLLQTFILNLCLAQVPELWGTGAGGGNNNNGVIFKVNGDDGQQLESYPVFNGANGATPVGSLTEGADKKLYGLTISGGSYDYGTLFRFDPVTHEYKKMYDFDGGNGRRPRGSMILGKNGILYGATSMGGIYSGGTLFKFNPADSSFTKILNFDVNVTGYGPEGDLLQTSDGKLYGVVPGGPQNGVLYSLDPDTHIFKDLFNFVPASGTDPMGSLTLGKDGKLYGMAKSNGAYNYGTIFCFSLRDSTLTVLYSFKGGSSGLNPTGKLVQDYDSLLYGVAGATTGTNTADGVIFSINPNSHVYKEHFQFHNSTGLNPTRSLLLAGNKQLYGLTTNGGAHGNGEVFHFSVADSAYNVLADCDSNTTGIHPTGELMAFDANLTAGIKQDVQQTELAIFPNPSGGEVNVRSSQIIDEVTVTNMLGQAIVNYKPMQDHIAFSIETPGLYLVSITSGNSRATKKLIISK